MATPQLGRHGVHNALAAAAVATCAGLAIDEVVAGLAREVRVPHRSQLIHAGRWTILDDSYNASPDAVVAALDLLACACPDGASPSSAPCSSWAKPREAEHRRVGRPRCRRGRPPLVVGTDAARDRRRVPARPACDPRTSSLVADRDGALAALLAELRDGDVVLVKASRGAALDLLVEALVRAAAGSARA